MEGADTEGHRYILFGPARGMGPCDIIVIKRVAISFRIDGIKSTGC